MEASQGLAEVETLSPQLAESYLRYVWVSGRVELAVPGLGLRWSGSHLPLGSAVALAFVEEMNGYYLVEPLGIGDLRMSSCLLSA